MAQPDGEVPPGSKGGVRIVSEVAADATDQGAQRAGVGPPAPRHAGLREARAGGV